MGRRTFDEEEEEILVTACRFPKHTGDSWEEVLEKDPSYIIWLWEQEMLDEDMEFLYEMAQERENESRGEKDDDDGWFDPRDDWD